MENNYGRAVSAMRHSHRHNSRAQSLVEFTFVFPVFIVIIFGGVVAFLWQLDLNSLNFASQEGVQVVGMPTDALGLECNAGQVAYKAAVSESFLGATPLVSGTYGLPCTGSVPSSELPDPLASCPPSERPSSASGYSVTTPPTEKQMLSYLNTLVPSSTSNVLLICATANTNGGASTSAVELTITIAGYKPLIAPAPILGNKLPVYAQDTYTVQEFEQ
ncbi:MAG: TadE/TadG family type IV pilus assembly protein [Candidatus Dormibacteria bacterium]